jgi:hypothetical protein
MTSSLLMPALIQHQLGHQELEPLDLDFELAAAIGVEPGGVVSLSPAMIGRLGNADISANVRNRQPLGQVTAGIPEPSRPFVGGLSFPHVSLLGTVSRGTPIPSGPVLGERTIERDLSLDLSRALHPFGTTIEHASQTGRPKRSTRPAEHRGHCDDGMKSSAGVF